MKRFISLLAAVVLALVGVVAVIAYAHGADVRASEHDHPVLVFVAASPIQEGTTVSEATNRGDVRKVVYPEGALPPGYLTKFSVRQYQLVFTSPLGTGEIVTSSLLGSRSLASGGLDTPEHMHSMTITVCQASAVGGFIGPGSLITVLNTYGLKNPIEFSCDSHQAVAGGEKTVVVLGEVQVLKVISTPPVTSSTGLGGSATVPGTPADPGCAVANQGEVCVTVAVTNSEMLALQTFNATGDLSISLLGPNAVPPKAGSSYPG